MKDSVGSFLDRNKAAVASLGLLCGALVVWALVAHLGPVAEVVKRAWDVSDDAGGLSKVVKGFEELQVPLLAVGVSVATLGVMGGGVAMALGARRGIMVVQIAIGGLIVTASAVALIE